MEPSDLLTRNRAIFKEIKRLAIKQEEILLDQEDGQIFDFLSLATKREHLLHEIFANEKKYNRLTGGRPDKIMAGKIHNLSQQISMIIESIQKTDNNLEKILVREKNSLMVDIKNVKMGRKALKGYGRYAPKRSRFMDKQG